MGAWDTASILMHLIGRILFLAPLNTSTATKSHQQLPPAQKSTFIGSRAIINTPAANGFDILTYFESLLIGLDTRRKVRLPTIIQQDTDTEAITSPQDGHAQ
ncbi:hypothetical protein OBBRIDRAFT_807237 [Obba rivulosa]|uniref:Secreted protein n=1 Tax=Obba rivulosa TaxID=1052685 RepID=A0A8E2ASC8_9APHY|nr:hypothetical protein OBBRIDRAFT_807237 [Obba rivulosa]